jgi:hypothetical protein
MLARCPKTKREATRLLAKGASASPSPLRGSRPKYVHIPLAEKSEHFYGLTNIAKFVSYSSVKVSIHLMCLWCWHLCFILHTAHYDPWNNFDVSVCESLAHLPNLWTLSFQSCLTFLKKKVTSEVFSITLVTLKRIEFSSILNRPGRMTVSQIRSIAMLITSGQICNSWPRKISSYSLQLTNLQKHIHGKKWGCHGDRYEDYRPLVWNALQFGKSTKLCSRIFVSFLPYFLTLKTKTINSSETSVFIRTALLIIQKSVLIFEEVKEKLSLCLIH